MENGKIRPHADPKSLNRSTQNLKQMIMSARRPTVQNFVQIRPLGASRQMGEIYRIFFLLYTFFVDRPTVQTARRIFTRDGSDNAASSKGQTFSGTEIRS